MTTVIRLKRPAVRALLNAAIWITLGVFLGIPLNSIMLSGILRSSKNSRVTMEMYGGVENATKPSRIFCLISTMPETHSSRAVHIKATWAPRCDQFLFFSYKDDPALPAVGLKIPSGRNHLHEKARQAFSVAYYNYYNDYEWFFKADDDTYAVIENLRRMLKGRDPNQPLYLGFKFHKPADKNHPSSTYMSGGSGYVISREALRRLVEDGIKGKRCDKAKTTSEDVFIGMCFETLGIQAGDSRDLFGRERFLPLHPIWHLVPNYTRGIPDWFKNYSYFPIHQGAECCSDSVVSIHYIKPEYLYIFDYLLYRVGGFRSTSDNVISNKLFGEKIENSDKIIRSDKIDSN